MVKVIYNEFLARATDTVYDSHGEASYGRGVVLKLN